MPTYLLDGENIRRTAEVLKLLLDAGAVVISAWIPPFRSERGMGRDMFQSGEFIGVHSDVPLSVGAALYRG